MNREAKTTLPYSSFIIEKRIRSFDYQLSKGTFQYFWQNYFFQKTHFFKNYSKNFKPPIGNQNIYPYLCTRIN